MLLYDAPQTNALCERATAVCKLLQNKLSIHVKHGQPFNRAQTFYDVVKTSPQISYVMQTGRL